MLLLTPGTTLPFTLLMCCTGKQTHTNTHTHKHTGKATDGTMMNVQCCETGYNCVFARPFYLQCLPATAANTPPKNTGSNGVPVIIEGGTSGHGSAPTDGINNNNNSTGNVIDVIDNNGGNGVSPTPGNGNSTVVTDGGSGPGGVTRPTTECAIGFAQCAGDCMYYVY
jgi:hypothetical protein